MKELKKCAEKEKNEVVDDVLQSYLVARGSIIEQELTYAVENWDTEYYAYEDDVVDEVQTAIHSSVDATSVSVEAPDSNNANDEVLTLPANADAFISVPSYAPRNIKLASYALNTTINTADYNKYAGLVRASAFESTGGYGEYSTYRDVFMPDYDDGSSFDVQFSAYYSLDEAQARAEFEKQYDEGVLLATTEDESVVYSKAQLEERENLKYYVVDFDGNVYSNIKEIPANLSNYGYYVLANGENVTVKGFELSNIEDSLKRDNVKKLCLYMDESFSGNDVYKNLYSVYKTVVSDNADRLIIEFLALFVLFVVMLIIWLRLIGNRAKEKKPITSLIEKLPNDIHTVLSVGSIVGLFFLWQLFIEDYVYFGTTAFIPDKNAMIITCVFLALCMALLTEWVASVVRTKKAGESWFKNTLVFKLIRGIARFIKKLYKKVVKRLIKEFSYQPKAYKVKFSLLFAGYVLMNLIYATIAVFCALGGEFMILIPVMAVFFIAFNILVGYYVVRYVNNLDKVIDASSKHEDVVFEDKDVANSLKLLANNLSEKNVAIDEAVAEAVKNEQMKTQLITNVSHDLKTPLTSLISYSDLLTKCEVEDEDAKKYIDVINQQSVKLKRLIEDLIEASKVSTGNVTLNKIKLNLSELAVQAIVEYTPDFEKNRNEVKFTEPETAPIVFADGTKTYRIISNLLSNAKKYSAADTRVYISVYSDGDFGCFEIKNISKEPLNISPAELTERFVRGDESRSKEGNGLGLSIAKDLCELQGGVLELKIDGDLFKAVVKLPVK